jgi:gluconokinase/shikimate kinase
VGLPTTQFLRASPTVLVLMGVAGSGKTTVADILVSRLGWRFEEGDALHPQSNIEKMRAGNPLTDGDRAEWLKRVADWVDERLEKGQNGVITCSALKRSYRDVIDRRGSGVVFVFLSGPKATIAQRLAARHGHFMPPSLLDSQFADLEEPGPDEPAIRVDISGSPEAIAQRVVAELGLDHA